MIASSGPLSIVIVPAQLSCGRRLTALRNLTSEAREAFLEQAKETGKHLGAYSLGASFNALGDRDEERCFRMGNTDRLTFWLTCNVDEETLTNPSTQVRTECWKSQLLL